MESHNVIFSPFNSGVLILFLHQKSTHKGCLWRRGFLA